MPSWGSRMPESKTAPAKPGRLTLFRRLSQLGALAIIGQWSFYGIFRCPFPVPFVSCQSCPVITCWGRITSFFWGVWLLIPLSVLLFGRSFCGWACPGGFFNQLIGKLSVFKLRAKNGFTRSMPFGLFLGLLCTLLLWLGMDNPRWAIPIRVGPFFSSLALTYEHASQYWLIRTAIVLGSVTLGLVLANFWCRFACPTGGLLETGKRFSLFKIYKTVKCNDCNMCLKGCEMGTRPAETNCTNCGDCLGLCPVDAIRIGKRLDES